jgi:hypothetical protein
MNRRSFSLPCEMQQRLLHDSNKCILTPFRFFLRPAQDASVLPESENRLFDMYLLRDKTAGIKRLKKVDAHMLDGAEYVESIG